MAHDVESIDQPGPPPAEAAHSETRLKGHIGHLTSHEESAFNSFRKLCAIEGFYTPATSEAKASHDDGTLMYLSVPFITQSILLTFQRRYLRARKFVPQDAYIQFKDTEMWRKQNDLDALYEKIDIHDYLEARSVVS